ncbi:protein draper-like isoform X2 [Acanthaster planci]|uniref:Protein draper-like isoform X2 n=1 Tax=Acanthaster planci TaxID=133434 RepID=A0A8B7YAI2_ACAPL|nr:protein draper-like isoform X2 [Acanthaster planci]
MDPVAHVTLLLLISTNLAFSQELTGPNVCAESVTRRKTKQVEHTTYTYNCQLGQQTCSVTRSITVYYTDYESRQICCKGWLRNESNCLTPCPLKTYGQNCTGTCDCTSANSHCDPINGCSCDTGWKPPNCSEPCDSYTYGFACAKNCTCLNEATCDPVNGSCSCTPGWMDPDCSKACPADRFGANCLDECSCDTGVTCDRVTGNCTLLEITSAVPEATNDPTEAARLAATIALIVGCIVFIVAVVGASLYFISKRVFKTIRARNSADPEERNCNSSQRPEDQCEESVIQPSQPAPNSSLEEDESDVNEPSLGNAVDEAATLANVNGHAEGTEAATSEAAIAEAEPVADGLPRAGTVRRNKRDELPPTLPRPKCSWAEDENAYCELGGGPEQNQTLASKPKPNVKPRRFTRKPSSTTRTETAGNEASNKREDPLYHVLNPDQSGED